MAKKSVKKKPTKKKVLKRKATTVKARTSSRRTTTPQKSVPVLVKVISIFFYIIAALTILLGIILLIGGLAGSAFISELGIDDQLRQSAQTNPIDAALVPLVLGSLILGGIIMIAFGILDIYIGRGLWKGKNWARILTIVFAVASIITGLAGIDLFTIIISLLIGSYLWFSPDVKYAFTK